MANRVYFKDNIYRYVYLYNGFHYTISINGPAWAVYIGDNVYATGSAGSCMEAELAAEKAARELDD